MVFKASLDVDRLVVDREPKIVVEFVVRPLGPCLPDLVDFTAASHVLVHLAADFAQQNIA